MGDGQKLELYDSAAEIMMSAHLSNESKTLTKLREMRKPVCQKLRTCTNIFTSRDECVARFEGSEEKLRLKPEKMSTLIYMSRAVAREKT